MCSPWMQSELNTVDEDDPSSGDQRSQQQQQPQQQQQLHENLINARQNGGSTSVKVEEEDVETKPATLVRRRSIAALVSSTVVRQSYQQKITMRHSLGSIDGVQGSGNGNETGYKWRRSSMMDSRISSNYFGSHIRHCLPGLWYIMMVSQRTCVAMTTLRLCCTWPVVYIIRVMDMVLWYHVSTRYYTNHGTPSRYHGSIATP